MRSRLSCATSERWRQAGTSVGWSADRCALVALGNWAGIKNLRAALSIASQANDNPFSGPGHWRRLLHLLNAKNPFPSKSNQRINRNAGPSDKGNQSETLQDYDPMNC